MKRGCYASYPCKRLSVSALRPRLVKTAPPLGPPSLLRFVGTVPFPALALQHSTIRVLRSRFRRFCYLLLKDVCHISSSVACASFSYQPLCVLSPTPHAFIESEVCFRPINASQAEAPPPSCGVLHREMIYPFTNFLFGTWMLGNHGCEKRMMGFLDCHLEWLAIQQILNEAIGGISCLKTHLPDS